MVEVLGGGDSGFFGRGFGFDGVYAVEGGRFAPCDVV